jgi:hypothetical protein
VSLRLSRLSCGLTFGRQFRDLKTAQHSSFIEVSQAFEGKIMASLLSSTSHSSPAARIIHLFLQPRLRRSLINPNEFELPKSGQALAAGGIVSLDALLAQSGFPVSAIRELMPQVAVI